MTPLARLKLHYSAVLVMLLGFLQPLSAIPSFFRLLNGFWPSSTAVLGDSGYLLWGGVLINNPHGRTPAALYRLSLSGDSLWLKTYSPGGVFSEDVCILRDGNFAVSCLWGYSCPESTVGRTTLAKLDSLGNLRWMRFFPDTEFVFNSISPTRDSGVLVTVRSMKHENGELWKFDRDGNITWVKMAAPGNDTFIGYGYIRQVSFGGYILAVAGWAGNEKLAGMARADDDGNILWMRFFKDESLDLPVINDICETSDSCFIACGGTSWTPKDGVWVWKIDRWGNERWRVVYLHPPEKAPNSVAPTKDGGCVAGGSYMLRHRQGRDTLYIWLIRFSGSGEVLWERIIGDGAIEWSYIYRIRSTLDGGFVFYGRYANMSCFVKTDSAGNFFPNIGLGESLERADSGVITQVFPNPVQGRAAIYYHACSPGKLRLEVSDVAGRLVDQTEFNVAAGSGVYYWTHNRLAPGIYFVNITTPDSGSCVKVLILR
ncbi:MAG: T9SS type A sorting domain-containing protein [candidate division WOR-3 bacterium]